MKKVVASLLATLPLVVAAQDSGAPVAPPQASPTAGSAAAQQHPTAQAQPDRRPGHRRDAWYIGFGLGGAYGSVSDGPRTLSFAEFVGRSPTTWSGNFKVGATLTPKLLLGFEMTVMRSTASEEAFGVTNYDAVATLFPLEEGFLVRAGGGLSANTLAQRGTNVMAGAGYAFWVGESLNLTANLDYSAQFWGGDLGLTRSGFWALGLGFDWY
jgi:hypothetical protein